MSDDPVWNAGVRKCLVELKTLKRDLAIKSLNRDEFPADTFAQLSLALRKRIERELRTEGVTSDYDSLALGAFQEALREAVVRKGPGLKVSLKEIAQRLQEIDVPDLWHLFIKHYLGNIFEWQVAAMQMRGETDEELTPEVIARLRKEYSTTIARRVQNRLKSQHPSHDWRDVDAFLKVFESVLEEETAE
jgi:hypothetical protein